MSNGNGVSAQKGIRPTSEAQASAYMAAVTVLLAQSTYLLRRIQKKIASADWDDAQSAARTLSGYSTDLNRMLARVRGKGRSQ